MATAKRPTPATPSTPPVGIFSEEQRRTLAALAEGFITGGGAARAAAAETAIAKVVDPALHGQLRLVLDLLNTRVGSLLIGGQLARYGSLKASQRDKFLRRWVQHPVPMLRSGAAVFRKLLSFVAYSDADEPADELVRTRLSGLGYHPTPNPTTSNVTKITAFDPGTAERIAVDVLVIGSGAGGGSIARDLSAAGREVLVIEAGGLYTEATFPTKERDAYERLYLDSGFTATADAHIAILAGGTVGGGTTVNWMTAIPIPEPVREEWEGEHGVTGASGDGFTRDLKTVLQEIGAKDSQDVPLKDAAIIRGAEKLGWSSERIQINRAKCGDCGTCTFGCKVGSKQSALRLHLAQAVANGARVLPDCKAEQLVIKNGAATGAITTLGTRAGTPRRLEIIAKTVVVSGGALRTPVLLQRSGLTHPAIGKNLRLHPVSLVAGVFEEPVEMWRGTMQAAKSSRFIDPDEERNGYIIESAPGHPGLLALGIPWTSRAEHARLMRLARYIAPFLAIVRDDASGSVTASRAGFAEINYRTTPRDERGLRHALRSMSRIAEAAGASEIIAAGSPPMSWRRSQGSEALEVYLRRLQRFDFAPNRGTVFSAHQMGTARMGSDSNDHVCDPWGRVRSTTRPRPSDPHGGLVKGLYVADGSLFPTALGVNPMVTILAVAKRVARTIIDETRP
jgi:choline dehydrogenase-like flavoprotein